MKKINKSELDEFYNILNIIKKFLSENDVTKNYGIDEKYMNFIDSMFIYIDSKSLNLLDWKTILLVQSYLKPIADYIKGKIEPVDIGKIELTTFFDVFFKLEEAINKTEVLMNNSNLKLNIINSENFYNEKIQELNAREQELIDYIKKKTKGESNDEIERVKAEAEATKTEIRKLQKELDFKKKQDEAKEDWKIKITTTFSELKTYLIPMRKEHDRLDFLYKAYQYMSAFLIFLVLTLECISIWKICEANGFPSSNDYFKIFLPIPIAGALLWGFIYQMNRAQRQMVVITKSIHNIEYIQGLLLSINNLSPTVEDGITRINLALDKLINSHFGQKEVDTEDALLLEEKKDTLPIEAVIKLLKEAKYIVK